MAAATLGRTARTVAALCTALVLCVPVPARPESDEQALARLAGEMEALAAGAPCGGPVMCMAVSMGYDACGNPTRHIPYNRAQQISEIMQTKAAEYTFIEEDRLRGKPRPAHCRAIQPPRVACVNGRCVVGDTSY
jgi:hypothetical protein